MLILFYCLFRTNKTSHRYFTCRISIKQGIKPIRFPNFILINNYWFCGFNGVDSFVYVYILVVRVSWKFEKLMIVRVSCVIICALCMIVRESELCVSFANNYVVATFQSTIKNMMRFFLVAYKNNYKYHNNQVFEH